MDDGEPQSYAQIGSAYGLSHNRVRQITDRSLRRLRQLVLEGSRDDGVIHRTAEAPKRAVAA
jgi:DNA-directed RNA polymerase sigma subunit (sigma70/sigma32)